MKTTTTNILASIATLLSLTHTSIASNPTDAVTVVDCLNAFIQLDFNIFNFDQFPDYFRDDSIMILAEAGVYRGADAIEEYVRFGSDTSPYIKEYIQTKRLPSITDLVSVNENGLCSFLEVYVTEVVFDPETTKEWRHEVISLAKMYLNATEVYIPEADIYYPPALLDYFYDEVLNSSRTSEFVCSVIEDTCGYRNESSSCLDTLAALPVTQNGGYFDGNSQSCRILHAAFAATNPANHCPHVSFEPELDPNGEIKCQDPAGTLVASDYFTEEDLAFYRRFARRNGFDPELGYRVLPYEEEESVLQQVWNRIVETVGGLFGRS